MNILVLNTGSSSLKFQIIDTDAEKIKTNTDKQLAKGLIERIGSDRADMTFQITGSEKIKKSAVLPDHKAAIQEIINWLTSPETHIEGIKSLKDIKAIGHRTVHGAETFNSSVKVTDKVVNMIEECVDLAPLHNPANLKGINAVYDTFGKDMPQVAVFDTAFHTTMPEKAYIYPVPYEYYLKYKVRKYGFHGTSHRYVSQRWRELTGKSIEDTNIITMHMGNGCSACAIKHGKSIDTSMGMTPLEGMMMGTRAGDIDTSLVEFVAHKENVKCEEIFNAINKKSGLLGVSGITNDMRDLEAAAEKGDKRANLAIEMFAYRAKKYIGSYLAAMNGADAIVFTGGIGENGAEARAMICKDLDFLEIELDPEANKKARGKEMLISKPGSRIAVWVIPTNEELIIARDTYTIVSK